MSDANVNPGGSFSSPDFHRHDFAGPQANGEEPTRWTVNSNAYGLVTPSPVTRMEDKLFRDENLAPHQYNHQPLTTPPDSTLSKQPTSKAAVHPTSEFWSQRARSSSPAALLSRHAQEGRDRRKTAFLDRVRQRRDDARSEAQGDQVLRMDFVREQKTWEEEMARRAQVDVGVEDEQLEELEEPTSPTEEHEINELVNAYYSQVGPEPSWTISVEQHGGDKDMDDFDMDMEGDEYDQIFQEISEDQISADGVGDVVGRISHPSQQHQQQWQGMPTHTTLLPLQQHPTPQSQFNFTGENVAQSTFDSIPNQPPGSGMDMS